MTIMQTIVRRIKSALQYYLLIAVLTTIFMPGGVNAEERVDLITEIRENLRKAGSAHDSLLLLYNIYDLSEGDTKRVVGKEILNHALRTGNTEAVYDIARSLSYLNIQSGSSLDTLINIIRNQPSSVERQAALTFVELNRISSSSKYGSEKERMENLRSTINMQKVPDNADDYQRLIFLFTKAKSVEGVSLENIASNYYTEINNLINYLPAVGRDELKSLYYHHAANHFSGQGEPLKAFAADTAMLNVIERLENKYRNAGRKYYNFDHLRFQSYGRILSNYMILNSDDFKYYMTKAEDIINKNQSVGTDKPTNRMIYIYRDLWNGRYSIAVDEIIEKLKDDQSEDLYRHHLLKLLKVAAQKSGSHKVLEEWADEFASIELRDVQFGSDSIFRELRMMAEIDRLTMENLRLKESVQQTNRDMENRFGLLSAVLIALLIISLVILYFKHLKSRRMARSLRLSSEAIKRERDQLKRTKANLIEARTQVAHAEKFKNDFLAEMSHEILSPVEAIDNYTRIIVDCLDEEKKKYLGRFLQIVTLNCELLKLLVTDVLGLSQFDKSNVLVELKPISVRAICSDVIGEALPLIHPGVELKFDSETPDIEITTDGTRVSKVLSNLLSNAAKFTDEGFVELAYNINAEEKTITFMVTDTGCGIPADKSDLIFQRFVKLGWATQGLGLGLPTCRLLARLLKGDVYLDTTYTSGARFIFTIPLSV